VGLIKTVVGFILELPIILTENQTREVGIVPDVTPVK
jgi:hypothetical protein